MKNLASHITFVALLMFTVVLTFLLSTLLMSIGVRMIDVNLWSGYAVLAFGVISVPFMLIIGYKFSKLDAYS